MLHSAHVLDFYRHKVNQSTIPEMLHWDRLLIATSFEVFPPLNEGE